MILIDKYKKIYFNKELKKTENKKVNTKNIKYKI